MPRMASCAINRSIYRELCSFLTGHFIQKRETGTKGKAVFPPESGNVDTHVTSTITLHNLFYCKTI